MKPKKKASKTVVLKVKIGAFQRKEGNGFQIFNGFGHPVEITFKKIARLKIAAVLIAALLLPAIARAEVPSNLAVRAIVGEAAGEGFYAMSAHAHAIRNRGTLDGVYGLNATHSKNEPEWVWKQARMAWGLSSKTIDPTRGASYWFSEDDLKLLNRKRPKWFLSLEPTVKIGSTTFYKKK